MQVVRATKSDCRAPPPPPLPGFVAMGGVARRASPSLWHPSSFRKNLGPKGPTFEAWKRPKMGWLFFQGSFPSTALQGWSFEAPHDVQDKEACCKMVF